jgi:hypothetical protein
MYYYYVYVNFWLCLFMPRQDLPAISLSEESFLAANLSPRLIGRTNLSLHYLVFAPQYFVA